MPRASVISCVALAVLVGACSSSPPRERGSSLSEAAEQAKKKEGEKQKVLEPKPPPEPEDEGLPSDLPEVVAIPYETTPADSLVPNAAAPPPETQRNSFVVPVWVGGGVIDEKNFDGFGVFGLGFGQASDHLRTEVSFLYMTTQLSENSEVVDALVNEHEFGLDLRIRYRFTPPHTFMGLYALVGGRVGWLSWDYQTPIVVDQGADLKELRDDGLTTYTAYLGLGISLVQTPRFDLGVDAAAGWRMYESYTNQGFNQDLFGDSAVYQLLFGAGYHFSF